MKQNGITVGILGLGLVGQALASRLAGCGYTLAGSDPSPAACSAAGTLGVAISSNAAELALCCELVVVCVLDDAALMACAHALATSAGKPKLVVSCVTSSVEACTDAAVVLRGTSDFADMPLLGSSQQIARGEALGLLGADTKTATDWADFFRHLCPKYRHIGASGYGVRAKLACNLVLGLNRAALAEGIALAITLGLDGTDFLDLLRESPAYSRSVDVAGPRMVARDFAPASRLRQHRKDLALILKQGEQAKLNLSLTAAHAELLDRAIAQGLGDLDNVAVISAIVPQATNPTTIPAPGTSS